MTTECFAMVRGAGLRVTELNRCGELSGTVRYAASKSVIRVRINEVTDTKADQLLRNEENEPRVRLNGYEETIRYTVDIEFIRVDPGILSLVSGVPVVLNAAGNVAGFDAETKMEPVAFGLEVWSRLAGQACVEGEREYGYTLFPFLKGGTLGGFAFTNGRVSFTLVGAQTRRLPRWGTGPYDIYGPWQRLLDPVQPGVNWKTFKVAFPPPEETDGTVEFDDEIDGGDAFVTSSDEIDGGDAFTAGPWEIDGGWA